MKNYVIIFVCGLFTGLLQAYTHHITNNTSEKLTVRAHFLSCSKTIQKDLAPGEKGDFSTGGLRVGCEIDDLIARDMSGTKVADHGLGGGMVVTTGSFVIEPTKSGSDTKYKYEFNVVR